MNEPSETIEAANECEVVVAQRETTTPTCKVSIQDGDEYKPMTLDEAIAHAEEAVNDMPCGFEHKQLAGWLKKLREIKNSNATKMHEVLEIISRTELPPNSHTTEVGEVITYADGNRWLGMMRTFVALAKYALSAQPEPIGNNAKIREALKEIEGYAWGHGLWEIEPIAKAALAQPPRNCDVGTGREQEIRFKKFCDSHYNINNVDGECSECPLNNIKTGCEFAWMHMPYEEGGEK